MNTSLHFYHHSIVYVLLFFNTADAKAHPFHFVLNHDLRTGVGDGAAHALHNGGSRRG